MVFIVSKEQEIKLLTCFFNTDILFYKNNVIIYAYENKKWFLRGEGIIVLLNRKVILLNRTESGNIYIKKKYIMHRINNYAFLKLNDNVFAFNMQGDEEFYNYLKRIFKIF